MVRSDVTIFHDYTPTSAQFDIPTAAIYAQSGTVTMPHGTAILTGTGLLGRAGTATVFGVGWNTIPATLPAGTSHNMLQYLDDPLGLVSVTRAVGLTGDASYDSVTGILTYGTTQQTGITMEADYGTAIASITVTGTGAATFGHAFAKGDVPAGYTLNVTDENIQVTKKATWSDGSLKFGIFSGVFSSAGSHDLHLIADPSATSLTEAALISALGTTTITLSGGVTGSINAATLLAGTPAAPGKIAWQDGPYCIERIVGGQISGTVYGFFHCRYYSNGALSVDFVIENAEALSANANTTSATTCTFTLAGTQVYSASQTIYHNTRFMETYWVSDPGVHVAHSTSYLYSTKAIEQYKSGAVPQTLIDGYTQTIAPYELGDHRVDYGSTGYHKQIGPLPEWDVSAIRNGFPSDAVAAVICNAKAANHRSIHYKDSATGYPVNRQTYPTADDRGWTPTVLKVGTGTKADTTSKSSHKPANGYLAYLLTGKYYFLETIWYWGNNSILSAEGETGAQYARFATDMALMPEGAQKRSQAWGLRDVMRAAFISPDSHVMTTYFDTCCTDTVNYIYSQYVTGAWDNIFGWLDDYDYPAQNAAFMQYFYLAVAFRLSELELGGTNTSAVLLWLAQWIRGITSYGSDTTWCWQYGVQGSHGTNPGDGSTGTYVADWATYASNVYGPVSCSLSGSFNDANVASIATYYGANLRAAVCAARDAGYLTDTEYNRIIGGFTTADFDAAPVWSTVKRG